MKLNFILLVGYVEERPWWPMRRKKQTMEISTNDDVNVDDIVARVASLENYMLFINFEG